MLSALLPLPFYLCCIAVAVLAIKAWEGRGKGWGIPMFAVVVTAFSWYPGDALYNNYAEYVQIQGAESLTLAWWEVLIFFVALGVFVQLINRKINADLPPESQIFKAIQNHTIDTEQFQAQVSIIVKVLIGPWILLMLLALLRSNFDIIGLFFPFLGKKANPWGRDRLGGGIDAIFAFAAYIQILLTALFGVATALSKKNPAFTQSLIIYLLSLPFFLFDRTRNTMLAVLLPGLMALVTLRVRGGMIIRLAVIACSFIALEGWMKLVIENRDKMSIIQAFKTGGVKDPDVKAKKHLGFNMLEELGYINYFIANGTYKVNWGERYFAELVNPIPRVLWPGKPLIGIDYAIARGMAYGKQDASSGGVACSVSTGMIGQGVVNFGPIVGPIAAAMLMAIWVSVLARQDLMGHDIGHLLLYAIGLVLTFNMGRDITLLVIYPFVFGWLLLWWNNRRKQWAS